MAHISKTYEEYGKKCLDFKKHAPKIRRNLSSCALILCHQKDNFWSTQKWGPVSQPQYSWTSWCKYSTQNFMFFFFPPYSLDLGTALPSTPPTLSYFLQLPEMEFLDISLTKDSSFLLLTLHGPFYSRILKKPFLYSGLGCVVVSSSKFKKISEISDFFILMQKSGMVSFYSKQKLWSKVKRKNLFLKRNKKFEAKTSFIILKWKKCNFFAFFEVIITLLKCNENFDAKKLKEAKKLMRYF